MTFQEDYDYAQKVEKEAAHKERIQKRKEWILDKQAKRKRLAKPLEKLKPSDKTKQELRMVAQKIFMPKKKSQSNINTLRELWQFRDLLIFMVRRDIKARYAQSVLGVGWAVVQPVFSMIVFTIIF